MVISKKVYTSMLMLVLNISEGDLEKMGLNRASELCAIRFFKSREVASYSADAVKDYLNGNLTFQE